MLFIGIFCLELLLLFFLSHQVTKACSRIFFWLTRSQKWTVYLLGLLFLPGTVVHEVAHYLTALLLFVPVGHMEFMPVLHQDGVKLGSVAIGKTDPFRRAIIGLAPLFIGLGILFTTMYYYTNFPFSWYINTAVLLFIVFEIGNTMFSSRRDVEGLPALLLVLAIFISAGWLLGIQIPQTLIDYIFSSNVLGFFQQLSTYLLIPLGIDAVVLLLSNLLKRKY